MRVKRKDGYAINGYLKEILPNIKNPVIFEIGANNFTSGKTILSFCDKGAVYYGFEPNPVNFPTKVLKNKPPKLNIIQSAISDFDGKAKFYQSGGLTTGASSLKKPTQVVFDCWPTLEFNYTVTVDVMKLDTFCEKKNVDHIDFIWADIQGAEYEMIMGAQEALKNTKLIFMEYSDFELYKGQVGLDKMIEALPGNWRLIHKFTSRKQHKGRAAFGDVFLQNDDIKW